MKRLDVSAAGQTSRPCMSRWPTPLFLVALAQAGRGVLKRWQETSRCLISSRFQVQTTDSFLNHRSPDSWSAQVVLPFFLGVGCLPSRHFLLEPFEEDDSREDLCVYLGKRPQPKVGAVKKLSRLLLLAPVELPKSRQTGRRTTLASSFRSRSPLMAGRLARPRPLDPYSSPLSAMNPSPSPPPSTVGLVRGDLRTSWSSWRESGEPQVFVARHTAATTSFEDANDLTREGFTPAPAQQLLEKKDLLGVILNSVFNDDTPEPPSRPREKLARTKSGLVAKMEKPLDTGKANDYGKTKGLHANPAEKLSSHNPDTQAMSSKRVVGTGASCESPVRGT